MMTQQHQPPQQPQWLEATQTTINEIHHMARRLESHSRATRDEQVIMLASFVNMAGQVLYGLFPVMQLPLVKITYHKVTKAAPRKGGEDYLPSPGLSSNAHIGRIIKVARNKQDGHIYMTFDDGGRELTPDNRARRQAMGRSEIAFTAVRIEGIVTFEFVDPMIQRQAVASLRKRV
jgi:hypothetical protein